MISRFRTGPFINWVLLLALLFSPVIAADYDVGLQAYQQGDFDMAYSEWLKVAMSPENTVAPATRAETFYALGMLFWVGQGVTQSTEASARWLTRAAEMGHPGAQTKLGFLYGSGQGVPQSDFAALKWTQMAANQGDADAQYNLGVFYRDGQGVEQDSEQALKWFREAAANGDRVAADVLTHFEKFGWGLSAPGNETLESESNLISENAQVDTAAQEHPAAAVAPSAAVENTAQADIPAKPIQAATTPIQPVEPGMVGLYQGEDWLRQRDGNHYTIQIIAVLDASGLRTFINAHPQLAPFAIYQQSWKGKPLWVLVQGDYVDLQGARAAVASFPEDIQQRDKMWIRRFGIIQSLLP